MALVVGWAAHPAEAQSRSARCDASLWHHVYHAYRLEVVEPCIVVTGTIQADRRERDGDDHVLVRLDAAGDSLLDHLNVSDERGDLVVEPVCEHAVTQADAISACRGFSEDVRIPRAGTRVRIVGAYVRDQDHGWMEVHPVTSITVLASGPATGETPTSFGAPRAPADTTTVWVNTSSGVYHCPGTRWYGRTRRGTYMSQARARALGYRPAYGRACGA